MGQDRATRDVWIIDAFAEAPLAGNAACVLAPFSAWPDDAWLQAFAREANQAETAYLRRTATPGAYELRWFTPTMEVPMCGHATLAAAHALASEMGEQLPLRFETAGGVLRVEREGGRYALDLPADPPRRVRVRRALERALGATVREAWACQYLIAIVEDASSLERLDPDLHALRLVGVEVDRGPGNVAVAAPTPGSTRGDVAVRFFAPACGIPEDPATGSAYCGLLPLFASRLSRNPVRFFQAYPGRGAEIEAELREDRVVLKGAAVTSMAGTLRHAADVARSAPQARRRR